MISTIRSLMRKAAMLPGQPVSEFIQKEYSCQHTNTSSSSDLYLAFHSTNNVLHEAVSAIIPAETGYITSTVIAGSITFHSFTFTHLPELNTMGKGANTSAPKSGTFIAD